MEEKNNNLIFASGAKENLAQEETYPFTV